MSTKVITKHQYKVFSIIGLLILIIATIYINQKFNLDVLATIGAASAIAAIIVILIFTLRNAIEKPINEWNEKLRKAQNIARGKGNSLHNFPDEEKGPHTIWHQNRKQAKRFYDNVVQPLTEKYPRRKFYYVTKNFNNISNGKNK